LSMLCRRGSSDESRSIHHVMRKISKDFRAIYAYFSTSLSGGITFLRKGRPKITAAGALVGHRTSESHCAGHNEHSFGVSSSCTHPEQMFPLQGVPLYLQIELSPAGVCLI
jgi:hypothetical protein